MTKIGNKINMQIVNGIAEFDFIEGMKNHSKIHPR